MPDSPGGEHYRRVPLHLFSPCCAAAAGAAVPNPARGRFEVRTQLTENLTLLGRLPRTSLKHKATSPSITCQSALRSTTIRCVVRFVVSRVRFASFPLPVVPATTALFIQTISPTSRSCCRILGNKTRDAGFSEGLLTVTALQDHYLPLESSAAPSPLHHPLKALDDSDSASTSRLPDFSQNSKPSALGPNSLG